MEDWFKNDPVNQVAGLEKQINDLCDAKSNKSGVEEQNSGAGSEPESQQEKVEIDLPNENAEAIGTNEEDNENEITGIEYSLPKDNANTVKEVSFQKFLLIFLF